MTDFIMKIDHTCS